MTENKSVLAYLILIVVIMLCLVFFWQLKNQETNLCRYILSSLVKGKYDVEKVIDWENLKALELNVGATYNKLRDAGEKLVYKKEFIRNFALGFQKGRGKLWSFRHWRIYSREGEKVVVAADYLGYNKTILFTLSKIGKSKLISLQWK